MKRTQRITPAVNTPISLAELKVHLRIDHTDEDALITSCLKAATEWVQNYTRRVIATETWLMVLDDFPSGADPLIFLPFGKIQSVSNIVYADTETTTVTLTGPSSGSSPVGTGYQESIINETAPFLLPPYSDSWPSVTRVVDPVKVTFVAGYGDTGDSPAPNFPEGLLAAIRVMAADYYERRSSDDVQNVAFDAARNLAGPYLLPAIWEW